MNGNVSDMKCSQMIMSFGQYDLEFRSKEEVNISSMYKKLNLQ